MESLHLRLRKWHRRFGVTLALFIFIQAASGLFLSFDSLEVSGAHASSGQQESSPPGSFNLDRLLGRLHYGGGFAGGLYRVVLAVGLCGMATSGVLIFFGVGKARKKN